MARAVFDPNVLVAALISPRGAPAALYLALTRPLPCFTAAARRAGSRPRPIEVPPLRQPRGGAGVRRRGRLERRQELQSLLQAIPDVKIDDRDLDKYLSFPVAAIADADSFHRSIENIEWVIDEASKARA